MSGVKIRVWLPIAVALPTAMPEVTGNAPDPPTLDSVMMNRTDRGRFFILKA